MRSRVGSLWCLPLAFSSPPSHLPWGADESDGGQDPVPHGLRVCFPSSQSFRPVTLVSCTSGLLLNIRGFKKNETSGSLDQKDSKKEAILMPCKPVSARNYNSVPDLRSSNPSCSELEFHMANSKIKEVKSAFSVSIVSSAQVSGGPCSGSGWGESCFLVLSLSLACSSSSTHRCCCLSLSFPTCEAQTVDRHTCWEGGPGVG